MRITDQLVVELGVTQVARVESQRWLRLLQDLSSYERSLFKRGEELLVSHLDTDQRADYATHSAFVVHSQAGHEYVVTMQVQANVSIAHHRWLCVVFYNVNSMPTELMLMQKLILEADEATFLHLAQIR